MTSRFVSKTAGAARGPLVSGAIVAFAACAMTASCQSHGSPVPDAGGAAPGSTDAASSQTAKPIDACALLSAQDISSLLGTAAPGRKTGTDPRQGHCEWENQISNESISVDIGSPGTAPRNTLPPALPGFPDKPGPDGTRYTEFGAVDFPAGNRVNSVQVAVLRLTPDQRNAAAVDLARKITPQVPR